MKRSSFTLVELVLVVAVLTIFATFFSGCGIIRSFFARKKASNCLNNLKQLSTTGQQYLNDHRAFWPNSDSKSYMWSFVKSKYVSDSGEGSYYFCPVIPRDPGQKGRIVDLDQSDIQMYAAIADNRAGRDGFGTIKFNSVQWADGAARVGGEISKDSVSVSSRIWFADGLRPDTQRQRTLLLTESYYTGERRDCARPYAAHDGRINFAAVDGHVAAISPDELKGYYLPYFTGEKPNTGYSVRANTYISEGDPKKVLTVE